MTITLGKTITGSLEDFVGDSAGARAKAESDTPRTDAHAKEIGGDDGLVYASFARELERSLSDGIQWHDADHDPPLNEQRVLGGWFGTSCIEGMETLIYHATARDGSCTWEDVHGEERDPPTHWTILEAPK